MKTFAVFNQAFATFDKFGCISGFRLAGCVQAHSPEHALRVAKEEFPLVTHRMVEEFNPEKYVAGNISAPVHKSFVGTKRAWR